MWYHLLDATFVSIPDSEPYALFVSALDNTIELQIAYVQLQYSDNKSFAVTEFDQIDVDLGRATDSTSPFRFLRGALIELISSQIPFQMPN